MFCVRPTYEEVAQRFRDKKCSLLTTNEQYDKNHLSFKSEFEFLAVCGHKRTTTLHNMRHSPIWNCKECAKNIGSKKKKDNALTSEGVSKSYISEFNAISYIKELLNNDFKVVKLHMGTKADICIQPISSDIDSWLLIQVKSTIIEKKKDIYSFSFNGNTYTDMLVVCIVIDIKGIWLINGNNITKGIQTLSITNKQNTKYSIYKVHEDEFASLLLNHYTKSNTLVTLNTARTPVGDAQKKEFEYVKVRETHLSFLNFVYPDIDNVVYDFSINIYKVQEKISRKHNDSSYSVQLVKSNPLKKPKFKPYDIGDNDYYWIHLPDTDMFYVIPEDILVANGNIQTLVQNGSNVLYFYPKISTEMLKKQNIKTYWANNYLYTYSNLQKDKLVNTFYGI